MAGKQQLIFTRCINCLGGGFKNCLFPPPQLGEMILFDKYFSIGLNHQLGQRNSLATFTRPWKKFNDDWVTLFSGLSLGSIAMMWQNRCWRRFFFLVEGSSFCRKIQQTGCECRNVVTVFGGFRRSGKCPNLVHGPRARRAHGPTGPEPCGPKRAWAHGPTDPTGPGPGAKGWLLHFYYCYYYYYYYFYYYFYYFYYYKNEFTYIYKY